MFERVFKLKQNNTTVKTEIMAGITTFMTMAYIIALNPNLLTNWGEGGQALWNGVFLATCISSAIGIFCMAFIANKPFALAPGTKRYLADTTRPSRSEYAILMRIRDLKTSSTTATIASIMYIAVNRSPHFK